MVPKIKSFLHKNETEVIKTPVYTQQKVTTNNILQSQSYVLFQDREMRIANRGQVKKSGESLMQKLGNGN